MRDPDVTGRDSWNQETDGSEMSGVDGDSIGQINHRYGVNGDIIGQTNLNHHHGGSGDIIGRHGVRPGHKNL